MFFLYFTLENGFVKEKERHKYMQVRHTTNGMNRVSQYTFELILVGE